MLGPMQKQLENFVNGNTCNTLLPSSLGTLLNVSTNLRVDLIENLRVIRNDAGHARQTKTKQDALDYIHNAEVFLDKWIVELK